MVVSGNASAELRVVPLLNGRIFLTKAANQIDCFSRVIKRCANFAYLIPDVIACTVTRSGLQQCRIFYGDRTPEIYSITCPDITQIRECVITVSVDNAILVYYNWRFNVLSICIIAIICVVVLLRCRHWIANYFTR